MRIPRRAIPDCPKRLSESFEAKPTSYSAHVSIPLDQFRKDAIEARVARRLSEIHEQMEKRGK